MGLKFIAEGSLNFKKSYEKLIYLGRGEHIGAFVKIGVPIIVPLFTLIGVLAGIWYKRWNAQKQREHEKVEKEKQRKYNEAEAKKQRKYERAKAARKHKREIEKIILDNLLKGYNFNNLDSDKLKELKESMTSLRSFTKSDENESMSGEPLEELKKIKEENEKLREENLEKNQDDTELTSELTTSNN